MDGIRSADVGTADLDLVVSAYIAAENRADEAKLAAVGQHTYGVLKSYSTKLKCLTVKQNLEYGMWKLVSITYGIFPVRRSLFELVSRVLHKVEAVYFGGGQVCWIVRSLHWHHHISLFRQRKFRL